MIPWVSSEMLTVVSSEQLLQPMQQHRIDLGDQTLCEQHSLRVVEFDVPRRKRLEVARYRRW